MGNKERGQPSVMPHQSLLRTSELAAYLGVHVTTLCRWSQQPGAWREAMLRRGWYSVARLRSLGLIVAPAPAPQGGGDVG
jgi:hypothetical protein